MTTSLPFPGLSTESTPAERLHALKELKNSVIGNTWKKVEFAGNTTLIKYLLSQLSVPEPDDKTGAELVAETAVILGALGSAGALTLRPLLAAQVPDALLAFVRALPPTTAQPVMQPHAVKMLPPILRALRNILGATTDAVWGHMWGVGAEQKVVGTGLVGENIITPTRLQPKARAGAWRSDATNALSLLFEPRNYAALLELINVYPDPKVLLPLYQLLARLITLPSHREALGAIPGLEEDSSAGPSFSNESRPPYLITSVLATIAEWSIPSRRPNPKLLEAALDLLGALVKGQPQIAAYIRRWSTRLVMLPDTSTLPPDVAFFVHLLDAGPPAVRVAVSGCLTNILKADRSVHSRDRVSLNLTKEKLLAAIIKLLQTETKEERVKLCFVLAALVSDDDRLQKLAAEQGCAVHLVYMLDEVDTEETRGELGQDAASRLKEGMLLALAALSFQHEPTRSYVAGASPPVLPLLRAALSHPSYGVRAAACQLARALSRTVAIVRTSLVDSGVGEEVVETLRREVARRRRYDGDGPIDTDMDDDWDVSPEEELGERAWTVEVAATATICNLVINFSPLQDKLLSNGGIELLVELTSSKYAPLALNALWALKNATCHADDKIKNGIMDCMGWDSLRKFLSPPTQTLLREQAMGIVQNLLDGQSSSELSATLDNLGLDFTLDTAQAAVVDTDKDLRLPALNIIAAVALGTERVRSSITSRTALLDALAAGLSESRYERSDQIQIASLRALRHLVESNSRSRRPRQAVVELLAPYRLKERLRELAETCHKISVRQGSVGLLDLLERAK